MANEYITTGIRLPKELVERLDMLAEKERRNRSNLLRVIIEDYLNRAKLTK